MNQSEQAVPFGPLPPLPEFLFHSRGATECRDDECTPPSKACQIPFTKDPKRKEH
jgi:hypothetical protein